MNPVTELLRKAVRVEVAIVLFSDDFYGLLMKSTADPAIADLDVCWQIVPRPGWTITSDAEGNMRAHATEPYEAPAGWNFVATMALVLTPHPSGTPGYQGRGLWFRMAEVIPTPPMEAFLEYLCDEMLRRAEAKAGIDQ